MLDLALIEQLNACLPAWDPLMVRSLVETVTGPQKKDAEDMIQNFLVGEVDAINIINKYMRDKEVMGAGLKQRDSGSVKQKIMEGTKQEGSSTRPNKPEKVFGMFKQGGRLRPNAPTSLGRNDEQKSQEIKSIRRPVVNCLRCGKIFDCRGSLSHDVSLFLENDGKCTFCGNKVSLSTERSMGDIDTSQPGSRVADEEALMFKNRLVEYDRNAAKRTNVIDDQSDFFEVDSNHWLTDQERDEMKQRRRLEEEADFAKKNRLTVTIDLMGRKVVKDSIHAASNVAMLTGTKTEKNNKKQVLTHFAATESGAPTAATTALTSTASPEDMARATVALRDMKIFINPSLSVKSAPTYILPAAAKRHSLKPLAASNTLKIDRVQDDMFRAFDEFGLDIADMDDGLAFSSLPYDICPTNQRMMDLAKMALASKLHSRLVPDRHEHGHMALPDGMCLLRGFLSLDAQADLVQRIRDYGLGVGGFYSPTFASGGQMHLKMFCLGQHWDARSHRYEQTRSNFDGAPPPPMPDFLVELANNILEASKKESGFHQPGPYSPSACICNFYENSGRLGYHQDKDESPDSLKRGLPVISISIGDAADFLYGTSPDEALGQIVRIESGDALVFGGPARMIYHAIPRIHPGTAPVELLKISGLRPGRLNLTIRQV